MRNYVAYGTNFTGRWLLYAYLDAPENLSFDVLENHDVRARFVRALTRPDEEYVLVEVKVRKPDKKKFLDAMEDLQTKMLICGHPDYLSHGGELIRELEDNLIGESLQDEKLMKRMGLEGKNVIIVDE